MVAAALSLLVAAALVNEVSAACSNPYTRPAWSDLSSSQKARYVAAARKLYERPTSGQCVDPNTASHRDFTQCHYQYRSDNHGTAYFWPWHRKFTRTYEEALQSVDSSVVLPYMDWHAVSQAPHLSDVWDDAYFGPNGDVSNGHCVTEGTFGGTTVTFLDGSSVVSHCFQRIWSPGPERMNALYSSDSVMAMLNKENFWTVSQSVEGGPHALVHNTIGGEMSYMYSAADPIFFLHHAYIDHLWWYWQTTCPSWANNFAPSSVGSSSHVLTPYSEHVTDVMSTLDGPFCYTYSRKGSDKALSNCPAQASTPTTEGSSGAAKTSPAVSAATGAASGSGASGSGSSGGSSGSTGSSGTGSTGSSTGSSGTGSTDSSSGSSGTGSTGSSSGSSGSGSSGSSGSGTSVSGGSSTSTTGASSAATTGTAYWLQNFIADLAPGISTTLHRRASIGDGAFFNGTDLDNSTNSDPVLPIDLATNTTLPALNQTVSINGTQLTIEKNDTVIPGTNNVTISIPIVNGTVALNTVAADVDAVTLATKFIPDDYEDEYVPKNFTGYIAYYQTPKKTVKTAKEYEAAKAKGETDVVLVLAKNDTTDKDNLRHIESIPLSFIQMNNLDVAMVRYIETFANTLVDVINITPDYTSPDALKYLKK
ncbi:hypothetical protein BJ742DRAFT_819879 [Cladochytrium replicatum]|nr:hypothetical protein BJ742DRAFT_819879 [Cladochytrium replicatum]